MSTLVKLETHYREAGIHPADFRCPCRVDCQRDLPTTPPDSTLSSPWQNTFTPGHSAFIGLNYAETVPRLLFVPLDLGTVLLDEDPDYNYAPPENRNAAGIQKSIGRIMSLITSGKSRARRTALRKTNELARDILHGLPEISGSGPDFMRFCARVNAVKCCMNKEGRAEADKRLYDNCREMGYLREEVEILSPHVIISQGEKTKLAIESAFGIPPSEWAQEQTLKLRDGKKALWFPGYHPSSYGPYKQQEKARNEFVRRVRKLFSE